MSWTCLSRRALLGPSLGAAILFVHPVFAAGHPEITPMSLGQVVLSKPAPGPDGQIPATKSYYLSLPRSISQPVRQALVLIAAQPKLPVAGAVVPVGQEEPLESIPLTARFRVGDRSLPDWKLAETPTAYVINVDLLESSPNYHQGYLEIQVGIDSRAGEFELTLLGMPDPLLAGTSLHGPFSAFVDKAADADIKAYFQALQQEIAGDLTAARGVYAKLTAARNQEVARLARRGLRLLAYRLRSPKLSGNFGHHYRWGLYLRQCGLYAMAAEEFNECRILDRGDVETQLLTGDLMERTGRPGYMLLDFFRKAGDFSRPAETTDWHVLVLVLESIKYMDEQGQEQVRRLNGVELLDAKGAWLYAQILTYGATRGRVRIVTSFHNLKDDSAHPYAFRAGAILAPPEDIVERRGWFDSVVSIRPRTPLDAGLPPHRSVGGDQGLKGAALTDIFHDASWRSFFEAWYEHYYWAAAAGESAPGLIPPAELDACGFPPVHSSFHGIVSSLHYAIPEEALIRPKIAIDPADDERLALWRIEGPLTSGTDGSDSGLPAGTPAVEHVQEGSFTDLRALFKEPTASRARATTWVYSPQDQRVRLWLGRSGPAAVSVNGRRVYSSRQRLGGKNETSVVPDAFAASALLAKGWNEIQIVCESGADSRSWGFSARLSSLDGTPVLGTACVYRRPENDMAPAWSPPSAGPHYRWRDVAGDYVDRLPRLTRDDFRRITGDESLNIAGEVAGRSGYFAVGPAREDAARRVRSLPAQWRPQQDRDVVLNNVMDWERESVAVYRYDKSGEARDLLFLKPEALSAFSTILIEAPRAAKVYEGTVPGDRLLGYVEIPGGPQVRRVLVLEAALADVKDWPLDEEDLLATPAR